MPSSRKPEGIAQAFLIGRDWIAGEACALALGDNLIHGDHLSAMLRGGRGAAARRDGVRLSGARPGALRRGRRSTPAGEARRHRREARCAAVQLGGDRPVFLRSRASATWRARSALGARRTGDHRPQPPLSRGRARCTVERLSRGCAWLDAGTPDSLLQAATFVQTIQSRTGMLVGCPEEVAFRMGYIDADMLRSPCTPPRQDRTWPGADGTGRGGAGMKVERLAIPDVLLLTPPRFGDARGFFSETWNAGALRRGRHSGPVRAGQPRLSRPIGRAARPASADRAERRKASWCACVRGAIWDVAVDVRHGSPTYGQHVGAVLQRRELAAALGAAGLPARLLHARAGYRGDLQGHRRLRTAPPSGG